MANFKKTGDLYVDPSNPNASDSNAGTNSDLPKLTIQGAISAASSGSKIIVADGLYSEGELLGLSNMELIADGIVILENNNTNTLFPNNTNNINIDGFVIINYAFLCNFNGGNSRILLQNCIVINSPINGIPGSGNCGVWLSKSRLINSNYDVEFGLPGVTAIYTFEAGIYDSIFINSSIRTNVILKNNSVQNPVELLDIFYDNNNTKKNVQDSNYNNYESAITFGGTFYATLSGFQQATGIDLNSISQDPLFNRVSGEVQTFDFSVQGNSPLIIAGENGSNIGAVKRGITSTRNSDSVQNGVISNIVFDGSRFQIQGTNTTGTITSDVIDFGLTVRSPIINIKGLVNFLDNVPDFNNALRDPNKLDLECRWAIIGEDITLQAWKPFLFNEMMLLDSTGKSNGEANFDWGDTIFIGMKQIQYRLTLRQNYNN